MRRKGRKKPYREIQKNCLKLEPFLTRQEKPENIEGPVLLGGALYQSQPFTKNELRVFHVLMG